MGHDVDEIRIGAQIAEIAAVVDPLQAAQHGGRQPFEFRQGDQVAAIGPDLLLAAAEGAARIAARREFEVQSFDLIGCEHDVFCRLSLKGAVFAAAPFDAPRPVLYLAPGIMQFNVSRYNRKRTTALPGPAHMADPDPETQMRLL